MELKYFNIGDDKDTLKKKWKQLALKYHPDRNLGREAETTKIMQEINNELAYCIKYGGGFDINKFNLKDTDDAFTIINRIMNNMIDEVINSEPNYSIRNFFTQARGFMGSIGSPAKIIPVLKEDDENSNQNPIVYVKKIHRKKKR